MNILVLKKYTLTYLGLKEHDVSKLLTNGQKKIERQQREKKSYVAK